MTLKEKLYILFSKKEELEKLQREVRAISDDILKSSDLVVEDMLIIDHALTARIEHSDNWESDPTKNIEFFEAYTLPDVN